MLHSGLPRRLRRIADLPIPWLARGAVKSGGEIHLPLIYRDDGLRMATGNDLIARIDAGLFEIRGGHQVARGRARIGIGPVLALQIRQAGEAFIAAHQILRPKVSPPIAHGSQGRLGTIPLRGQHIAHRRKKSHTMSLGSAQPLYSCRVGVRHLDLELVARSLLEERSHSLAAFRDHGRIHSGGQIQLYRMRLGLQPGAGPTAGGHHGIGQQRNDEQGNRYLASHSTSPPWMNRT